METDEANDATMRCGEGIKGQRGVSWFLLLIAEVQVFFDLRGPRLALDGR